MIRVLRRFGLIFLLVCTYAFPSYAVSAAVPSARAIQSLTALGADIVADPDTGLARFVSLPVNQQSADRETSRGPNDAEFVARSFLQTHGVAFGNAQLAPSMTLRSTAALPNTGNLLRFQQTYNGVPVLAGELYVEVTRSRQVARINGEVLSALTVNTVPTLTESAAEDLALTVIKKAYPDARLTLTSTRLGLWIFDPQLLGSPETPVTTLNWRFEIRDSAELRALVLINAHTGATTIQFNQIAHALDQRVCNGNNVMDTDTNQNNDCATDSQATRLNSPTDSGVADVDVAWANAKATYDYFNTVLGRDSIDNAGMKIISLVNYCPNGESCPYQNAFWDGIQMTYGATFASADDVVAHELTHGVTEKTAGLFYYFQSGAINESLSDVFGELVDLSYAGPGGDDPTTKWLMGEDLSIGAIRSMSNPGLYGDPDKMTSSNYNNGLYLGQISDNGGVHSNSGVNNKAVSLMVDGGVFNGYTVGAIDADKVGKVYYYALSNYLLSGSDYLDLGLSLNAACSQLLSAGLDGFVTTDCQSVKNAVLATEMAKSPPRAPATDAAGCTTSETKIDLYNETFETITPSKWTKSPSLSSDWYYPAPDGFAYATSGRKNVALLYPTNQTDQKFAMNTGFYVPTGTVMSFRHAYEFEAYYNDAGTAMKSAYDGGIVEYSLNAGATWVDAKPLFVTNGYNATLIVAKNTNVLAGRMAFTGLSHGYITSKLNLNTLAGSYVRLRFRSTTDKLVAGTGWFIDDVNAYRCLPSAQSAATLSVSANSNCLVSYRNAGWCWGANQAGQLGTTTAVDTGNALPLKTNSGATMNGIAQVAVGASHSCALTSATGVVCWGSNTFGQLGDGTTTARLGSVVTTKADGTPFSGQTAVTVGATHTCALSSADTVSCWGQNAAGQLGDGTTTRSRYPVTVRTSAGAPLNTVKSISAGSDHTCAILTNGTVWCWGNQAFGATGSAVAAHRGAVQVRTATAFLTGISRISSGKQYTCALAGTAASWCWGRNSNGQLGDGTTVNRFHAVAVKIGNIPLVNLIAIAAGAGEHSCALGTAGQVYCWGANTTMQLGDGSTIQRTSAVGFGAAATKLVGPLKDIAVGQAHSCGRTNGGAVWCWGQNTRGQLGNGSKSTTTSVVRVRNARAVYGE
jgi:bacillolysin